MSRPTIDTAVILAAGAGTKFWPYNVVRQKAAFPIANVPMVRRLANSLVGMGIRKLLVVTGAGERSVRVALHNFDAEIRYVRQRAPEGSADAVLHAVDNLDEDFLVVAGDIVSAPANIQNVVRQFAEERPLASVLVQQLAAERPQDWIVARVEEGMLAQVEGHGRQGTHRIAGVYAFRPDAVRFLRDNPGYMSSVPVGGMPPPESEIGQSLQMALDDGEQILAVDAPGYLVDVDKPWHVLEANHKVLDAMRSVLTEDVIPAGARIHDGADIDGRVVLGAGAVIGNRVVIRGDLWLGDGARIENGAILDGPAVVGGDAIVRDYCLIGGYSSLGARGVYGHGAEFSGLALEKVHCYHYCEIWGVVGEAVDFGAATVCGNLRFDDGETQWRVKGRAETPGGASNAVYFGDFSRTGVNAMIMPGRRIGVYSCVGAGVVAYDDVPDRELLMVRQELERTPWGPEQYGW